jgi:hypothetical protein
MDASGIELPASISKDRAIRNHKKISCISMLYDGTESDPARRWGSLFCPAARFAVCNGPKMIGRDCFEELRPILGNGFSALSRRRTSRFGTLQNLESQGD